MDELLEILKAQMAMRPLMRPQDGAKLLYQSEFGGGHLIRDEEAARAWLMREAEEGQGPEDPLFEDIGGGSVRLNLRPAAGRLSTDTVFRMFLASSRHTRGNAGAFREKLTLLDRAGFDREETERFLTEYVAAGMPMLSHSQTYRDAYAPAYRVVDAGYRDFWQVFSAIDRLSRFQGPVVVGIDGMCASGKSTLGELLAETYGAQLYHADDYFLPPEKRSAERLSLPGGNMDRERRREEILLPLERGAAPVTRRFDCKTGQLGEPVPHIVTRLHVVEGSYCLHPELADFYTLKIALRTTPECQRRRLTARDPQALADYLGQWIPLENRYFEALRIFETADMVLDT